MILPKLLIHFADFPYQRYLKCRAANPRALMRFGTTNSLPFYQTIIYASPYHTPHNKPPHGKFTPQTVHRRRYLCRHIGNPTLIINTHVLLIVSSHLLPRTNPSLHSFIDATTSKICATYTSTRTHARPSQVYPRQPTTHSVTGLAKTSKRHPFYAQRASVGTL